MATFKPSEYTATGSQFKYEVSQCLDGSWTATRRPIKHHTDPTTTEWLCEDNTWQLDADVHIGDIAFYPNENVAINHITIHSNDLKE